ncbi:MAG: glycosyltransferase family 4 protein [Candidatus Binatia bacterium]
MLMRKFYPLTGGYQNQALRLARELRKNGFQVHVVTQRHGTLSRYELHQEIPIYRVFAFPSGHLAAWSYLISAFFWMVRNRERFQIIHANRSSSGLVAGLIGFVLRKPVLYKLTRGDEIDVKGFRTTFLGRFKVQCLKHTVDKFVAITKRIEEDLRRLGIPSKKLARIPNGIELNHFSQSHDRERVKSALGWGSETKVATFVGRLIQVKGVDWLLRVWRDVSQQEPLGRLLIIGDGPERPALEDQVRSFDLTDSVALLGRQEDVFKFLAITDVFVLPSRLEGVSNALLEAMSQGLPVIVADDELGGNREVVDNRIDGYIVKIGDDRSFTEILVKLLRDAELRNNMGRKAKDKIEQRFSMDSVVDGYCRIYNELSEIQARSMAGQKPSVGIFLARPDRSFHMARKLREKGFNIIHYNTVGYKDDSYVKVRGGPIAALAHLLLRTNNDIYFTSLGFVPSTWLYLNKRLRRKPYVFNATGLRWETFYDRSSRKPFSSFFSHQFYPFLLHCTFAGASRIVCNSHFLERTLSIHYPKYKERLLTIYNGIEFDRYASGRRRPLPGVDKGDLILLCVTALNFKNKSKGLQIVMDAFDHVRAKRKDAKLVISAKTSNPLYQKEAESYLESKPWRDSVTLMYNHSDIPDLLASGDIFVYATPNNSNDSLPRALLEAQSAGLPVVTTDTSGCPEIVRDGKTGFVVPYEASAMAERILQLMDSPQLRLDMGREAQEWIRQRFNWDQMASAYAKVFLEVAAGQQRNSLRKNI